MLYVSKILSRSKICITDSDDGVEDVLGANEIVRYITKYGLHIEGVRLVPRGPAGSYSVYADVCQPPETVTSKQAKTALLNGVDIVAQDSVIRCIRWSKESKVDFPVSVRLSDFGTSCAEYLFWWDGLCRYPKLTLIFDDKIKVGAKSLRRIDEVLIVSDIREVTDPKLVDTIYKAYTSKRNGCAMSLIIDTPERKRLHEAINFCSYGRLAVGIAKDVFYDSDISQQLAKMFGTEFKSISQCKFAFNERAMQATGYITCRQYGRNAAIANLGVHDFVRLRDCCAQQLRTILSEYTTCNSVTANRFCNYVKHFSDIPTDIQDLWVTFCSRANEWLYDETDHGALRN